MTQKCRRTVPLQFCLSLLLCTSALAQQPAQPAPPAPAKLTGSARLAQLRTSRASIYMNDFGELSRYRDANAALPSAAAGENRVVFYGDSITDGWKLNEYFPGKPYVNRGISGQTTAQMLVRFRQDVIDLHPKAVVILAGTNDVAGNTGPMTPEMTENNWQSMADLAKMNGIRVIFASITPSTDFWWHKGLKPAEKIRTLNAWLKGYCASQGLTYLDYYTALTDDEGGMKKEFTVDGVHASA